jgi:hypothetical protein
MENNLLSHIEGVSYCTHPAFIADIETWKQVVDDAKTFDTVRFDSSKHTAAVARAHRFETTEELVSFVERNKHQIIVYRTSPP